MESWVYKTSGQYFFSYATSANNNCMLLQSSPLTANAWSHIVVACSGTNSCTAYLNGVATSGLFYSQWCGTSGGSFNLNQEQDSVGGSFDSGQTTGMQSNGFALYTSVWSASD